MDELFYQIKEKYPEQLLMADCSTVEEAIHADELGFDFIGTTLVGYTEQSKHDKIEANDFEILRKMNQLDYWFKELKDIIGVPLSTALFMRATLAPTSSIASIT